MNACSTIIIAQAGSSLALYIHHKTQYPIIFYNRSKFADSELHLSLQLKQFSPHIRIISIFEGNFENILQDSINDQAFSFLLILQAITQHGIKNIDVVMPYFPFARQINHHHEKTTPLCDLWINLLFQNPINHIISCDMHNASDITARDKKIINIKTTHFWEKILQEKYQNTLQNCCIVSPDVGGAHAAQQLALNLQCSYAHLHKHRPSKNTCSITRLEGSIEGKHIIILDDILDTGNTALQAAQFISKHKIMSLVGCFTHGIFSTPSILQQLSQSFKTCYIGDTIHHKTILSQSNIAIYSLHEYIYTCLTQLNIFP